MRSSCAVVIVALGALALAAATAPAAPPTFPATYEAVATLSLPYAGIQEDMYVWYDEPNNRQRIDYYGGMDSYIMLGNANMTYKTIPTGANRTSCYSIYGSLDLTSVFPNTTGFQLVGTALVNGKSCLDWQYVEVDGARNNTYDLFVDASNPSRPIQYRMMGYDSLFGSHYDLYVVDYHIIVGGVAAAAFNLPDMQCVPMPGTTGPSLDATSPLHDLAALHPGSDAQRRSREREDQLFDEFKQRHGKQYSDRLEHQRRRDLFHHNARFVNGKNRQGLSYKLALNHLADLSRDELRARNNKLRPKASGNGAMAVHERALATEDLPPSFDWRVLGAVSPVKDQAVCGSCWSFGAAQTIEGALFRETGVMTLVSSQALVDCSWDYGNNGCDGGLDFQGYQWIMDAGGIPGTADYPYLGADGVCHATTVKSVASLAGYVNVTTGSEVDLMDALVSQFPVSISIDASHPTFSFYASGVYYEPQCGNTPDDLDHTVLLVGYGTENGQDYWLVKNSWSTYWGDQGYVKMSRLNNNCGVETTPTYVVLKSQRAHA